MWGIKKQGLKAVRGQSMSFLSSNNYFGQYIWARYLQVLRYLNFFWCQIPQKINIAVDLPLPSSYWENRYKYNAVPVSPLCSGNYIAPWSMGSQKMSWVHQKGKRRSFINDGIDFMHNISGKCIQTFCSPPYQGQFYSQYTTVSSAGTCVGCQTGCVHTGHALIHWLV